MGRAVVLSICIVALLIVVAFGWRTPDKPVEIAHSSPPVAEQPAPAVRSHKKHQNDEKHDDQQQQQQHDDDKKSGGTHPPKIDNNQKTAPSEPVSTPTFPPSSAIIWSARSRNRKRIDIPAPYWSPRHKPAAGDPPRRIIIISFIDSSGSNNVGIMYGAASRLCYAKRHGYTSIIYGDKDLQGWIPKTKEQPHGGYRSGTFHRMWSKNFLLRRAMFDFNLTERDWVMWMDSDTLITRPDITLETMIRRASVRRKPDGTEVSDEPDMIVADTYDGINNGNMLMRKTPWSLNFLTRWWEDQNSNHHAADNGPFMHSVLVALAESRNITYNNECHMRTNPSYASFHPMAACYTRYLHSVICGGNSKNCVSRVPHSNKPWDYAYKGHGEFKKDWEWGYILAYSPHIGGNNRINDGLGWRPCALWSEEDSFLLHMAGHHGESRNRTLTDTARKFRHRYGEARRADSGNSATDVLTAKEVVARCY